MEEKKRKSEKIGIYRRLFACFFLAMAGCTIISRVYDSVTVPKVRTAWMKEKAVESVITGTGTVKEREVFFVGVYPGLRVASVSVAPGKQVEEGDELFCYAFDSMEEKRQELEDERKKLGLDLQKESVSGETYGQVTESELAAWELSMAERELMEGRQEYEERMVAHKEEMERLFQDYERKKAMTKNELWEEQMRQEEAARQQLNLAENSRDSSLKDARRKVQDLEEELEEMKEGEYAETETARKERELARAREDLEDLEDEWDGRLEDVELEMDLIDSQNERIRSGETTMQAALLEAYEESVRQEEKAIKQEEKGLKELEKSLERARQNMENAARRDEYARLGREQKERLSRLVRQGLEMDIEKKEREIAKLEAIMENGGKVHAKQKGVVAVSELVAGRTTSGEERMAVAAGSFWFEGEFDKEEQRIAVGDEIEIRVPGSSRKSEVRIDEMNLLGEQMGVFRAELTGEEIPLGAAAEYECKKRSKVYRQVIPLKGLRKDVKGYYCLIARPQKAILGEEFVAARINVEVICQGNSEAAVEGALQSSDRIITGGSQVIGEGDRVRVVEGEAEI